MEIWAILNTMRLISLMLFLGLITPGLAQENHIDSLSGHEESGRKLGHDLEKGKFDFSLTECK